MGMAGPIISGAVGLFGASQSSAAYERAAQQAREQGKYNAQIVRYNSEASAQATEFGTQAEAMKLTRNAEIVGRQSEANQAKMLFDSTAKAGLAKATGAAAGAEVPTFDLAIADQSYRDFLERQQEMTASGYAQNMYTYDAQNTLLAGVKTAHNQRLSGLFDSFRQELAGNAQASQYSQMASNTMTQGIFGAIAPIAGGLLGG